MAQYFTAASCHLQWQAPTPRRPAQGLRVSQRRSRYVGLVLPADEPSFQQSRRLGFRSPIRVADMASPTCAGVSRPRRGVETLLCCGRRILGFERQHSLFQSRILLVSRPSTNLALLRPFVAPRELAQRQARVAGPIWPGRAINAPPSSPPRSVSAAPLPAALRRSRVGLAGQGTPATRRGVARDAGRHRSDCQPVPGVPLFATGRRRRPASPDRFRDGWRSGLAGHAGSRPPRAAPESTFRIPPRALLVWLLLSGLAGRPSAPLSPWSTSRCGGTRPG